MIGAIIGDIIGSRFEFANRKDRWFDLFTSDCCFTDDSVMTLAVAEALMRSYEKDKFATLSDTAKTALQDVGYWYPCCGFGGRFHRWIYENPEPYGSCGNGAAMRISPVGDIASSLDETRRLSEAVTAISHDHEEGIRGAEATAVAIYLARSGRNKEEVMEYITDKYYPSIKTVEEYHKETDGHGKELCQISVPQAFAAFYEGHDYESTIRNCVYIGGDTDTTGAIAGGVAEAYYGVPYEFVEMGLRYLDRQLKSIYYRWNTFKKKLEWGCDLA